MAYFVKECSQVYIYDKSIAPMDMFQRFANCLAGVFMGPEPVAMDARSMLIFGHQILRCRLLEQPVGYGRDSQKSCFTVPFGNFNAKNGLGQVRVILYGLELGRFMLPEIIRKFACSFSIDSCTALIGGYLPKCFLQVVRM